MVAVEANPGHDIGIVSLAGSIVEKQQAKSRQAQRDELKKVYKGKNYRSKFRNNALKEEQMQSQVDAELEFSKRLDDLAQESPAAVYGGSSSGIMPIQIEVPTSGQVYRFAKSIIKPDDELSFGVIYVQMWADNFIKWIIILFIILLVYFNRQKFEKPLNYIKEKSNAAAITIKKNQERIRRYTNSYFTPIILFGLMLAFSPISYFITLILLALFLTSIINLLVNYSKKRKLGITDSSEKSISENNE
jgi:hypothetical protein